MSEDKDLAALRAKRQQELEQQVAVQQQQEAQQENLNHQRQMALMTVLTDTARNRLANIKMANPEFAASIENQLLEIAQSGRLQGKVNDEQLKTMLRQLQGQKRERVIKTVRK